MGDFKFKCNCGDMVAPEDEGRHIVAKHSHFMLMGTHPGGEVLHLNKGDSIITEDGIEFVAHSPFSCTPGADLSITATRKAVQ